MCVYGLPNVFEPEQRPWIPPDQANADGETLPSDTRIALCRCARSGNKPPCGGSHSEVGFEAG